MGDMLNPGYWQWVQMEYHLYEFLEVHICIVAYCNVELAVCILFVVWDIYSYQGSMTASFPSSGLGLSLLYLLYNSHHCQSSPPVCWGIPPYPLALPLSVGSIMMLLSSYSDLIACLSVFKMFGFGSFDSSSACLTFYLSSSAISLEIFKAASSICAK